MGVPFRVGCEFMKASSRRLGKLSRDKLRRSTTNEQRQILEDFCKCGDRTLPLTKERYSELLERFRSFVVTLDAKEEHKPPYDHSQQKT